jgi:hypothetical protein
MAKYKIIDSKGAKVFSDTFSSKVSAQQAIVDAIKGGNNQNAMKYIKTRIVKIG